VVALDGPDHAGNRDAVTAAIAARLGAAYERLTQTFASVEAYRDHWRAHPSMQPWSAAIEAYVDHDLVGEPPQLQPACRMEAAQRDGADLYATAEVVPRALPVPSVFLRAERGMLDEPEGLYAPGYPSQWLPGTQERTVAGVNHYSIVLGAEGAHVVADAVSTTDTERPG
jgi:lipase